MVNVSKAYTVWGYAALSIIFTACGATKPWVDKTQRDWQTSNPPPSSELQATVYLIGDVGAPDDDQQEPSLKLLESQLRGTFTSEADRGASQLPDSLKSVIFLGDNIYEDGLSEEGDPERENEEFAITEQLNIVKDWDGQPVFIPGNHDWDHSGPEGVAAVTRQGNFVSQYLGKPNVFLPRNGCPGPIALPVSNNTTLVLLDTEWWLTDRDERPNGPENGCYIESELDLIVQLDDMLNSLADKHVVLAFHHPLATNGNHGSHYSLGDHIFPLRLVWHGVYFPLPVIGSIYPLARMYGASRQDLPNPKYQQLKNAILGVVDGRDNVVLASGHEHSLQLHDLDGTLQVVSGSGCKDNFCVGGKEALFVHKHNGFSRINYYKNGEAWIEFWIPEEDGSQGKMTFRMPLYALKAAVEKAQVTQQYPNYADSVKVMAANPEYNQRGKFGRWFLGDHYRKEWAQPVKLQYLDIKNYKGGLQPIKKGGGKQTLSLRLQNPDSIQYNIRSIDKNPSAIVPGALKNTFASDLAQDQISSAHPYGALTIPKMADAIGVYHTDPELFYVPYTPMLGPYMQEFGGMMSLVEIRPDEDLSGFQQFGFAEEAVSTNTMLRKLLEDNDDLVDQRAYLRARLFDMLIGDWDRHQDQWRWAEFENKGKGKTYVPIPRDRDQVYVKFDGFLPWLATRKWAIRNFQHFGYEITDVRGLNLSAMALDRRLLTTLSKEEWEEEADFIQLNLTDEVIEAAIRDLPPDIFEISGEEIIAKLKSRRDQMLEVAREYYSDLSKKVDIYGSDKHELVKIERLENGDTKVQVYKVKKDSPTSPEKEIYSRTFHPEETKEIRIWGFDGEDRIEARGDAKSKIKIRVLGGNDDDTFLDKTTTSEGKIIFYDNTEDEVIVEKGPQTKLRLEEGEAINQYNADEKRWSYVGPRLSVAINPDDGLFLGGGITVNTHGFRKEPASTQQFLEANYAIATQAFNIHYQGSFYSVFGKKNDLLLDVNYQGPQFVLNYFGQGNDTENIADDPDRVDIDYYRVRLNRLNLQALFNRRLTNFIDVGLGPVYREVTVLDDKNADTYLTTVELPAGEQNNLGETDKMAGGTAYFHLKATNHPYAPTRGIFINTDFNYLNGSNTDSINMLNFAGDFGIYITPNGRFQPTIGFRVGGERIWGDYRFYQSATLGNRTNLRGFRNDRFAGRSSLYQNLDVRVPLSSLRGYVLTGNWGLLGFLDSGRVWADNQESDTWHVGYGGGLYVTVYQFFVLSGSITQSKEGPYFLFKGGFQF